MKSKRNQYLLLTLVVIIWGLIVLRFFSMTGDKEASPEPIRTAKQKSTDKKGTTYTYRLNYPDPFLKNAVTASANRTAKPPKPAKSAPSMPSVAFLGVVSSGKSKMGILKVSGNTHMVKTGDQIEDLKVLNLSDLMITLQSPAIDSVLNVPLSVKHRK